MTTTNAQTHEFAARARRLKDELAVQRHLAAMDLRDALTQLGGDVERVAHGVERVVSEASDELARDTFRALSEANDTMNEIGKLLERERHAAAEDAKKLAHRTAAALERLAVRASRIV